MVVDKTTKQQQLGRNRGIPKTQRVLASTNKFLTQSNGPNKYNHFQTIILLDISSPQATSVGNHNSDYQDDAE